MRAFLITASALAIASVATTAPARQPAPASAPAPKAGSAIYAEACAACHQAQGQGIPGAFPALKHDPIVEGPAEGAAAILLNGRGGMPAFKTELDDASIASVLTYVRSAWGNAATPIATDVVSSVRGGKAFTPPPILQAH